MAQIFYLLKSKNYPNIWAAIENRVHHLAEFGTLDAYHLTNILRSFSRSQENQMSGSEKLFIHLEPLVLQNMEAFTPRDLSHIAYAYGIRAAGNTELHKAIEKRWEQIIAENGEHSFDYPLLHNLIYYMMFTENKNETIWKAILESTLSQEDVLPIIYYKPYKFSAYFLREHFPNWNLDEFTDKFYYAERYWNQI